MDVTFDSQKLRDKCNNAQSMNSQFGKDGAQALQIFLDDALVAGSLATLSEIYDLTAPIPPSIEFQLKVFGNLVVTCVESGGEDAAKDGIEGISSIKITKIAGGSTA